MKIKKYNPVFEQDEMQRIQTSGDGYSGFVQPGNSYIIGCFRCFRESKIHVTNTGSTDLKFHLSGNESFQNNGNHVILQPGELITLEIDANNLNLDSLIHVTNMHVGKQGSFVVAVFDNGRKKSKKSGVMIKHVDD